MSSSDTTPKRRLLAQFATVARALGHEHRLELLERLGQGERTVDALALRAGLAEARRDGKHVLYRLKDAAVPALLAALRRVAERNPAEVWSRSPQGGIARRRESALPTTR